MNRLDVPIPPEIRIFLEELLKEAKIDNPDPVLKEMMIEDLYERLQVRFTQVLVEHLEEQDLEQYAALTEEDQVKALEFLHLKNNNLKYSLLKMSASSAGPLRRFDFMKCWIISASPALFEVHHLIY